MLVTLAVAIEFMNAVLLSGLLYVYAKNYRRLKSKFTLGLFFFGIFFLIESVIAAFFYSVTEMCTIIYVSEQVRPVLSSIKCTGLVALTYITWK